MVKAKKMDLEEVLPVGKLIYIGPNITRLGLAQFQVYSGGKPLVAAKAAEIEPSINRLFVPLEEFAKARASLTRDGSLEKRTYAAVAAAFSS